MKPLKILDTYRSLGKNNQDILWNVASFGLMALCGLLINILIASFSGAEALGVYNQVYAIYIISSQFSALGVHLSVLKHISEFVHDKEKVSIIFFTGLILSIVLSFLACGFVYIFRIKISVWMSSPLVAQGIVYSLPGLFLFTLNKIEFATLNALSRMKVYATFQSLRYLLMFFFAFLFIKIGLSYEKFPLLFSYSEFIIFFCLLFVNKIDLKQIDLVELYDWLKKHFTFGLRGFMSNVLTGLNPRVDTLLIGFFSTDSVVGIFSLAATAAEGLYQLAVVMRTNINPYIVQYLSSGQYDKLVILSRQAIKNTYKAISIIGLLSICIFPMSFLLVKNNAEFVQSWPIFAILVFGIIFSAGYIPFSNILLLAGYPGQHSIMILIQVFLNICGNILLIPFMGGYGAAIATSFSNILLIFLIKKFSMKILKLRI